MAATCQKIQGETSGVFRMKAEAEAAAEIAAIISNSIDNTKTAA